MDGAIAGVTLKFRVCKLSVVERNFCVPKSTTFPLDSTWEAEPRHRLMLEMERDWEGAEMPAVLSHHVAERSDGYVGWHGRVHLDGGVGSHL